MVKKKKPNNSKKIQRGAIGNFFVFGILALLIILGITAVGGTPSISSPQSGTAVQITTPTPGASHNNLQLETFGFTTIAPTSVTAQQPTKTISSRPSQPKPSNSPPASNKPICQDDDDGVLVPSTCQCPDDTLECISTTQYEIFGPDGTLLSKCNGSVSTCGAQVCGVAPFTSMGRYCVAKPIIYLYPTAPTYVAVQVKTKGKVVVSNPTYPQGGWKNILAFPDGNLQYHKQPYSELFYESSISTFEKPTQGIVIPTAHLTENLNEILGQLGLVGSEKQEFLSFWVPKLQALNSSYIFFSVLSPTAKKAIDNVIITPKPETQIAFIAYFKPINSPNYGSTLQLPPTPQRIGFTSVEWGGIIDGQSLLK